jgi:hypothetical protein
MAIWRRRAGALAAARARTRRNAGRRERAHCALARTNLRIVPMKTGRLALGGPRLNLCAVECGAAPVRRWVHKARAPGLHARTSSHSTSTSVLPCVLRRPRPARRRQLAQHLHQRPPMRPPSPAARAAAPARTAPPTTSVLPCVLRRPRPARRRQLAQHLLPPASSHASSVARGPRDGRRRSAGGLTDRSTRIASPAARHATLISCTHPR